MSSQPHVPSAEPRAAAPWSWLLLAALPVFLIYLGANSIWDANEAFYVETPRQMVVSGDYVTPRFNDADRVNKPVLSYWIVAGLYRLFGASVGVERLGIALGAFAIVLAAFLIGRALRSTTTGALAALIVATAPRVVMHARRIFIDVYITAFMSLTLACFVLAERHPERRRLFLRLMYVCIGLGTLTKGPIAIAFPVLAGAIWLTVERRWSDVRRLSLVSGALIVLAIVVPWYVALYARHGWGPVTGFFLGENVDRYLSSMVPGDSRPAWWYLPVLFTDLLPWAPLLAVPLALAWRRSRSAEPDGRGAIRRLLWIWIVCIVGVFSLSQTKQDLYIFPVVTAVAALVADALVRTGFGRSHRVLTALLALSAAVTMAAGGLVGWLFTTGGYALAGASVAAAVLVAGGGATLGALALRRNRSAVALLAATFIVFDYVFVGRILPDVERFKPTPAFAATIAARGAADDRVGSYHYMLPSLVFYSGRPVHEIDTIDQARAFYAEPGAWAMMRPERYEELRAAVPGLCVADRRPVFEARVADLLDRTSPPQVFLVTNRCG